MATRSPTLLLLRDEFIGYAKSRVMLVLWILMPLFSIGIYLAIPDDFRFGLMAKRSVTASMFISFLMAGIAGTVSSLMIAVDIVSERNRKVFDLFVIRPVPRDAIIWSKFIAVISAVMVTCVVALACAVATDLVRGRPLPSFDSLVAAFVQMVGLIAINTAGAVFMGVLARSVLVAVVLVQFVSNNLTLLPALPIYFGIAPDQFWLIMGVSCALSVVVVYLSVLVFRRTEL